MTKINALLGLQSNGKNTTAGNGSPAKDQRRNRAVIVYQSSEGQTRKISEYIARSLETSGLEVDLFTPATAPRDLSGYALSVVAGSIHYGRHDRELVSFVKCHSKALASMSSAFLSVSLAATADDAKRSAPARQYLTDFLSGTSWKPDIVRTFAGALRYSQYGFFKKQLLRVIAL